MADGSSGIKQLPQDIGEAVIKPVVDEVGKALEVGVQSVTGSYPQAQLNPEEQAKKKEEEEKKKQEFLWRLDKMSATANEQAKVRAAQQQQLQSQHQEKQVEKVKQLDELEKEKQQQAEDLAQAQRRTEVRKGVGG
ncbi:MAG: hypothetical protein M1607_01400 [Patescibacteria group bacterium]|nr:hypothetical protein [Patescibacteria group bacterium]